MKKKMILAIGIVALFILTVALPAGANLQNIQERDQQAQTVLEGKPVYKQPRAYIWLSSVKDLEIDWQKKIGNYCFDVTITGIACSDSSVIGSIGYLWEILYGFFGIDTSYYFDEGDYITISCSVLHAPDVSEGTLYGGGYNIRVFE